MGLAPTRLAICHSYTVVLVFATWMMNIMIQDWPQILVEPSFSYIENTGICTYYV
jgi:hypothetical protein